MNKHKIVEILQIIIAASSSTAGEAAKTIQAVNANSPILQQRLNHVITNSLRDLQSTFTDEERALVGALMDIEGDQEPTVLSIRLTRAERAEVSRLAEEEGYSDTTSYVRAKIGL